MERMTLRKQKLWVWQGRAEEAKAWRDLGFQPVTLGTADVMVQLQTGGLDAFITSPLVVAANQYFASANDMTDLKLAPFVGGLVVSLRLWESIPPDLRSRLEQATVEMTRSYKQEFLGADAEAIRVMKNHGLATQPVSAEAREAWRQLFKGAVEVLFGKQFDKRSYEVAEAYIDELRSTRSAR